MTDLESVTSSLAALAQREPHAPECPAASSGITLIPSPPDGKEYHYPLGCTCDHPARVAAAQARVVLEALDAAAMIYEANDARAAGLAVLTRAAT